MHVLDNWTTVEPVELLYQDTPPRWAPAVVSGSFQGFGAAQRHQQHEERPRRRRQHRAQSLHGAAVGVPVHFGCLGAAPQLMMRTKHFPALSTMNKMWPSRTCTCFQCETVTAEWERIKGCSFFCYFIFIIFVFQFGALFLAICYILEQKPVLCWILELTCAICTVHRCSMVLAGFSTVFIDLPKVFDLFP